MKKNLLNFVSAIFFGGLVVLSSCSDDPEPLPLAAPAFSVATSAPEVNLPVKFENSSLKASFYVWDFGDGEKDSTNSVSPSHTYDDPGNYTVTLRAYNDEGEFAETTQSVSVGERFLMSASIINISMVDDNGEPWDAVGGPDVLFEVGYSDAQSIDEIAYAFVEDLNYGGEDGIYTPISITVDNQFIPEDFVMSYNEFYIAISEVDTVDNEAVFIDMAGVVFNPLEASEDDSAPVTHIKNDDGTGLIQIPYIVLGEYQFLVTYEVR